MSSTVLNVACAVVSRLKGKDGPGKWPKASNTADKGFEGH